MKTPKHFFKQCEELEESDLFRAISLEQIAAIQSDAREGMVPAAQLQPTIELLHLLRNRYSAVIHPTSVQDINTEISRLQFILVKNRLQKPNPSTS